MPNSLKIAIAAGIGVFILIKDPQIFTQIIDSVSKFLNSTGSSHG